jgi:glycosyltransferase involved in cell wall biosynthesis
MLASAGQVSSLSVGVLAMGLASRLPVEVGVLDSASSPHHEGLERADLRVHAFPFRYALDPTGLRKLRRVVASFQPSIIHCWDPAAARIAATLRLLFRDCRGPALVVSGGADVGSGPAAWITSRPIRGADHVIAATRVEGERYRDIGVAAERLTLLPPAVEVPPPAPDRDGFCREVQAPTSARFIVTAGRLEPNAGMKAAVWAFDMLRYEFPELHLLIFGDGPGRAGLERFGRSLGFDDFRIRFPGTRGDLPSLLRHAAAVWVTSDADGLNLALQTMAAGRPVVAWNSPDMAEIIKDGATGLLVSPGDRVQLAARTHAILRDPAFASKLGAAGFAVASSRHQPEQMIARYMSVYESLHAERRPD